MVLYPKMKKSLGNYFLTLLSVLRISQVNGKDWFACDSVFKTFFDNPEVWKKKPPKGSKMLRTRALAVTNDELDTDKMEIHSKYNDEISFVYQMKPFSQLPESVKQWYQNAFKSLNVRKNIRDEVSKYTVDVGVHIRTFKASFNDGANNEQSWKLHKEFSKYLDEFRNVIRNQGEIFLCCDDIEVIENLRGDFPNIRTYERNNSLSDIENDFVEFLILSKCRKLYGTYFSTFSDVCYLISENVVEYTSIPVDYEPLLDEIKRIIN